MLSAKQHCVLNYIEITLKAIAGCSHFTNELLHSNHSFSFLFISLLKKNIFITENTDTTLY